MRRQVPLRRVFDVLWTHPALRAVPMLALLLAGSPAWGESAEKRPIRVAPLVGARVFADPLALQSEFAFGMRVSMGVSDRVSIAMDAGHSSPVRKTSGSNMSFGEIRLLTTVALLRGSIRPYALAGIGGQFFNFYDTSGTASLLFAGGLGVEYAAGERWSLFAEGSADAYRASFTQFDYRGYLVAKSLRQTLVTGVITFGVQYGF
ncbi:MAG: hypothetical protein AAB011_10175 [Candidatus Eisenbacteria bacterium]